MKMKLLLSLAFLLLFTEDCYSEQLLEVKGMKLLEANYSVAKIEIELNYDGSIGDRVLFGATAMVDENISGAGFKPSSMSKGLNKLVVELVRPNVMHNESFTSHSIEFTPYTRNISKYVIVPFKVEWPSYEQKFSSEDHKTSEAEQLYSIETVMMNEALHSSRFIITSFNFHGLSANQMNIIYKSLDDKSVKEASVRIAEGVSISDIKLLVKIIEREGLQITNIGFLAKNERNYKYGHVGILEKHFDSLGGNTEAILESIKTSNDLKNVYKVADFTPYQKPLSNEELVAKAEMLIQRGGYIQLTDAKMILNKLMDKEYYHPKIFWLYSKIYLRKYSLDTKSVLFALFLLYLILSWIYKRFIKLPDIEDMPVDNNDPIIQEQIRKSQEQIARFLDGLEDGKLEALIKFPIQIDEMVEHVWGLAHSKKSNLIIASLKPVPVDSKNDELLGRLSIPIKDIEDWMLIDKAGETQGGYSVLAEAQIYQKTYGRLPKKYIKRFEPFVDISWPTK